MVRRDERSVAQVCLVCCGKGGTERGGVAHSKAHIILNTKRRSFAQTRGPSVG